MKKFLEAKKPDTSEEKNVQPGGWKKIVFSFYLYFCLRSYY